MAKTILSDTQKKKLAKGLCIAPYCTKKNNYEKTKSYHCHSCNQKRYIQNNPLKYTFINWRQNCKRRKKVNTVTFDQFKIFVEKFDYMKKKGIGTKQLQIDRIIECNDSCPKEWCNEHGYHNHNIQCITLRENRYKYAAHKGHNFSEVPY